MRRFEDKEFRTATRTECVRVECDLCGKVSSQPLTEGWELWGAGTGWGKISASYSIDGDYDSEEMDLCYECAKAVMKAIEKKEIKSETR